MTSLYDVTQTAEYQQELAAQRTFMLRIYGWMTLGLVLTAATALVTANVPAVRQALLQGPAVIGILIAHVLIGLGLNFVFRSLPSAVVAALFLIYAGLTGVMLSSVLLVYTQASIASTLVVTAGTFGATTAFGYVTKRDLSGMGTFLMMGLIGIIIASIVNFFMASSMMHFVISVAGVVVFTGLAAYETQMFKQAYAENEPGSDAQKRLAIFGAFMLYLDFVNLFIFLLRLIGQRED